MSRITHTTREIRAGCFSCHRGDAHWFGPQAQGTAARHHDATGHATWTDVHMAVRYGDDDGDDRQLDIEIAIAALRT